MPPKPNTFGVSIPTDLTRRRFVKAGGALFVSLGLPKGLSAATLQNQVDATRLASWLEIRSDHTILARTGRAEIGTGMSAFYAHRCAAPAAGAQPPRP